MALKRFFNRFKRNPPDPKDDAGRDLDVALLKSMMQSIVSTHSDEIGCDECFEQLDRFVEMELVGKSAAEAMPLVQDHLDRCGNCREEYLALLAALRALA